MLKVGVIGAGHMGRHHVRVYSELKNCKLVAISDTNNDKREMAQKHKCGFYENYKDMFGSVDAVSICTPTRSHKRIAMDFIRAGKHVFIEKPIADAVNKANAIIREAKKHNVKLQVGHIERFNPAIIGLKKMILEGRIGSPLTIIARRIGRFPHEIKDIEVMRDLVVHDIDLINDIVGAYPERVMGDVTRTMRNRIFYHGEVMLAYGEITGIVALNWVTPVKIRKLEVAGTNGFAEANMVTQELALYKHNFKPTFRDFNDFMATFGRLDKKPVYVKQQEPLKSELKSFVDCINKNTEPVVTGEQATKALEICLRATK